MKKILIALLVLVIIILSYVAMHKPAMAPAPSTIAYQNSEYGFSVSLPENWQGYTVSTDTWTGNKINGDVGDVAYTTGPLISIHNPKWTAETPYQDIPIMVFTLSQWDELSQEVFHIGAAPIGPSELGRNTKYVFALPARYNYAFPPGFEEVEQILQSKPLKAF